VTLSTGAVKEGSAHVEKHSENSRISNMRVERARVRMKAKPRTSIILLSGLVVAAEMRDKQPLWTTSSMPVPR
jgi:hypothetical protein